MAAWMPMAARLLYSLLLYFLTPLAVLRLAWRGHKSPGYRSRWAERFGFVPRLHGPSPIWLHAVSVGETQAALPLIRMLLQRHPHVPLLVTTTTATGSDLVRRALGDSVVHCYLPYDLPGAAWRFLQRVRPRLAVVMETELWPNLFHHVHRRGVPLILANARLSQRSLRGYGKVRPLIRATLDCLDVLAAQTAEDGERFQSLGAEPSRLRILGNIKFDLSVADEQREAGAALREALGRRHPVWIAASTHEGEEAQILEAFREVREVLPEARLILVPRHPERFRKVEELCRRQGYGVVARSRQPLPAVETDVYLGDTMGELLALYSAADVAFVGGSLVPTGGHNPLEPAALGVPVLTGPRVFNFQAIMERLTLAGAARFVAGPHELATALVELLCDSQKRHAMGERGQALVAGNRGAVEGLYALVEERLCGSYRPWEKEEPNRSLNKTPCKPEASGLRR